MKIETVVITPELAANLLKKNVNNRPLDRWLRALYAKDMSEGRWKLNAETIKVNGDRLLDGQHRLEACVASGKPFVSLVAYDVPADSFDTIDRGKSRTTANIFAILGIKHAVQVAAAAAKIQAYVTAQTFETGGMTRVSSGKLEDVVSEWPEIHTAAQFITKQKLTVKIVSPGTAVALCALMFRSDESLARAFWSDFNDQTNMFSVVTLLRERMLSNKIAKAKLKQNEVAALIIKAWNAVKRGDAVKTLRWRSYGDSPESMPIIE